MPPPTKIHKRDNKKSRQEVKQELQELIDLYNSGEIKDI